MRSGKGILQGSRGSGEPCYQAGNGVAHGKGGGLQLGNGGGAAAEQRLGGGDAVLQGCPGCGGVVELREALRSGYGILQGRCGKRRLCYQALEGAGYGFYSLLEVAPRRRSANERRSCGERALQGFPAGGRVACLSAWRTGGVGVGNGIAQQGLQRLQAAVVALMGFARAARGGKGQRVAVAEYHAVVHEGFACEVSAQREGVAGGYLQVGVSAALSVVRCGAREGNVERVARLQARSRQVAAHAQRIGGGKGGGADAQAALYVYPAAQRNFAGVVGKRKVAVNGAGAAEGAGGGGGGYLQVVVRGEQGGGR